jgi:hypothetical protein
VSRRRSEKERGRGNVFRLSGAPVFRGGDETMRPFFGEAVAEELSDLLRILLSDLTERFGVEDRP